MQTDVQEAAGALHHREDSPHLTAPEPQIGGDAGVDDHAEHRGDAAQDDVGAARFP